MTVFFAIGVRWIWRFRAGQPLDIDEASYLGLSFFDYDGLTHNGLAGYFSTIESSSVQAPMTAALAALVYCITGPHWAFGFSIPLLAGGGIILASYALGRTICSSTVAAIGALLVGSCPLIINYSRSFHFALPATLMATMALYALLKSDRCRHLGWASLFGLFLGLMPLARTMTLGFVPGIVAGALIYVAIDGTERKRHLLTLTWSLSVAAFVTGAWLFPNSREVFNYLLNYGYGNHAAEYGPSISWYNFENWLFTFNVLVSYVYLPHACVMVAGALALVYLTGQRAAREQLGVFESVLSSNVLPLVVFIAEAVIALVSTQNKGSAFSAPFVPSAIVLSVYACHKLCSQLFFQRFAAATAATIALIGTLPSIDWKLSHLWAVNIPILGPSIVMDGRGTIQQYEATGGFRSDRPAQPIQRDEGRAWVDISALTADKLNRLGSGQTTTAFGFRHYVYNVNTVALEQWIHQGTWTALEMVDPIVTRDTVAGDVDWLTRGQAARACLLLTAEGEKAQFSPVVNQRTMVEAGREAGFESIDKWAMPDGQAVTLWRRTSQASNCTAITARQ